MDLPAGARTVAAGVDLDAAIAAYEAQGYRLVAIWPADDPRHAVVQRGDEAVELVVERAAPAVDEGRAGLLVTVAGADTVDGRAGMQYRDLIPGRLGGRFIASSIRIPDGGPVPDYVHHHDVDFQLIFCAAGWVRVVYEDQGPPFVLEQGDAVLQPPGIRHRVLEASPGLEVIEISSPAEHVTFRDHDLELPTAARRPDRDFGGQRFVRHVASTAAAQPWRTGAARCLDLGVDPATDGSARVQVAAVPRGAPAEGRADAELTLLYVLGGTGRLDAAGREVALAAGTAVVVPPGERFRVRATGAALQILDVAVGRDPGTGASAG